MGKLQPNFSWQKYEDSEQNREEQFQYQLQQEHIQVANTTNSTIDDMSFFTKERMTSETWITGKPIWKKTLTGVIVGTADTAYPSGITITPPQFFTLVQLSGVMQNPGTFTDGEPLPYVDTALVANQVELYFSVTAGVYNLHIVTGNGLFTGYQFAVTVMYTKD